MLVCPEPLGHGQPAGIGIRFVEIARVLVADGHEVTVLTPGGGSVTGCRCEALSPEQIATISEQSDVAVVQGHAANDLFAHAHPIPTIVDLYDPFIVENLHYFHARGAEVFTHDHATLMQSLVRGDLFLCASSSQRLFYLGLLLAAGRLNPMIFESDPGLHGLIRLAPFGVQPPRPVPARDLDHPAILFGGVYDWYDPILAIDAVAIAHKSIPALTLTFTRHPNPELTPQGKAADAVRHVKSKGYDSFVRFEPWTAYDERGAFFDHFTLALLAFSQSLETELAMRTRIYDFLWGALPVISSAAPGTGELLASYGAGVTVEGETPEAFAAAILATLRDRTKYDSMVGGTRAFVRAHQWRSVLEPLVEFIRAPRFDETKEVFAASLQVPERPPSILDRIKRRIGGRT